MNRNPSENFTQFCAKKSFEISYALLRVSEILRAKSRLADRLEDQAFELMSSAAREDLGATKRALTTIRWLVKLGSDGGILPGRHGTVLTKEIDLLHAAIVEFEKRDDLGLNLENVFTRETADKPDMPNDRTSFVEPSEADDATMSIDDFMARQTGKPAIDFDEENGEEFEFSEDSQKEGQNESIAQNTATNIVKRQSAMADLIRQSGNLPGGKTGCQFRYIQESFPGVSERTIRYDLSRLMEEGMIERVGSGGPGSSYRLREGVPSETFSS